MPAAHFILQGKGGIGKSLVASLIAQYYQDHSKPMICIDTDPINATFASYKAFSAQRIHLLHNNKIREEEFDSLMAVIADNPDSEIIIDNGASGFIPLTSYLIENQAIELLQNIGRPALIHIVIMGHQALEDTLNGFDALANEFSKTTKIILWLNEFQGEIKKDGKLFEDMKVYKKHKHNVTGIIRIKKQSELFAKDLQAILEARETLSEALQSKEYHFMSKNRLHIIKKDLFQQIDLILNSGIPSSS